MASNVFSATELFLLCLTLLSLSRGICRPIVDYVSRLLSLPPSLQSRPKLSMMPPPPPPPPTFPPPPPTFPPPPSSPTMSGCRLHFFGYELCKVPEKNEIAYNNYNPNRLLRQFLIPPPPPVGRCYTFFHDENYWLDSQGLVIITFDEYRYLSWHSSQTQITPPYFQQGKAWIPVLQLASLLRHGSDHATKRVPLFECAEEHISIELHFSVRLLEMLDKKVRWRQNGKEIRGTLSAFDPTREFRSNKMVWQATIHANGRPWQFEIILGELYNGTVEIELDVEKDTEMNDSKSGCGNDTTTAEICKEDGDMCD